MIGTSPGLEAVRHAVAKVAPTDATVLLLGESGTGKELVAHSIHDQSKRRDQPFIAVSCVALAPGLITSELFGHEVGAFTGASKRRIGKFEQANGGTLFLDEIGEIPPDVQALLLRALQERVIERVGGDTVAIDVRIIAATNRDLQSAVRAGTYRADLFYRLDVFPIIVPPLRERRDDIPLLVSHFVRESATRFGKEIPRVRPSVMKMLISHDWPGNIRQLQNIIERAVIFTESDELWFDAGWLVGTSAAESAKTWSAQERQRIIDALKATGGRVYGPGGAAHRLGLKPTTLYGKMRKHGIERSEPE